MSENKSQIIKPTHEIVLRAREKMNINGVTEIINFDENEVNLKTVCGSLIIEGEGIHINVLNTVLGEVELYGKICGINYYDLNDVEKHSILSKIFK